MAKSFITSLITVTYPYNSWQYVNPVPSGAVGKTASGGCSAGQGSSEPVAPRTETSNFSVYHAGFMLFINQLIISFVSYYITK
jgi:hypothetical protein